MRALLDERKAHGVEIADLRRRLALADGPVEAKGPETVAGMSFLAQKLTGVSGKDLRGLIDAHKARLGSGVILLVADTGDKAAVAAGVTSDLTARVSAVDPRARGRRGARRQGRRRASGHGAGRRLRAGARPRGDRRRPQIAGSLKNREETPMPAYWIAHVHVTDADRYGEYARRAGPAIEAHGGRFLARGGKHHQFEGDDRARNVLIEFPDLEAARTCYQSPAYQEALAFAKGSSERDVVIVEGV